LEWVTVSGGDIASEWESSSQVTPSIPAMPAIYCWKYNFSRPAAATRDSEAAKQWISDLCSQIYGLSRSTKIAHWGTLDQVRLVGPGLNETKTHTAHEKLEDFTDRIELVRFVESLTQFAPPIYSGETSDLRVRVRDHISGDSGFGERVIANNIDWEKLDLHFIDLSSAFTPESAEDAPFRQMLEYIITATSLSGFVERIG
jgi:hypothetical protein